MSVEPKKRGSHLDPPTLKGNWLEKAKLITAYHKHQVMLNPGKRTMGKWTVIDTAQVLGCSVGYVSESIRIGEFVSRNRSLDWSKVSRGFVMSLMRKQ